MNEEERVDTQEYLRDVKPLYQNLNQEYRGWLQEASPDGKTLSLERDPDGQHAAVYLYRVGGDAIEFVQHPPVKAATKYHEDFSLCLEARAAAAEALKEAADYSTTRDPGAKIAEANRKIVEAERQLGRATAALREVEERLGRR
jgi:hypothetical protein